MAFGGESGMDACRAGEHAPAGTPLFPKPVHGSGGQHPQSGEDPFLWVIARPARTVGARATGRGASPTCFQTCAGTGWQSVSAGKFGQPVARAQVVLQAG